MTRDRETVSFDTMVRRASAQHVAALSENRVRFTVVPVGRSFATFEAAERYARGRVKAGVSPPGTTEIRLGTSGVCLATIDRDAYDRIWADLRQDSPV
jgi:hypothetical protein